MKIGIDAKWLFRGPPSGRRVVHNLVRSLIDLAPEDELHFFLDEHSRDEPLPAGVPRERCHYVWARNNQLSNVFVVSRLADRLGLDAVVYQNFVPMPVTRHARVAFVHDVIFDSHPQFFTPLERLYFKPLRRLTSTADRVCTVSQSERTRLVRYGYATQAHIDVVPNGVDAGFVPRECLPAGAADRVLARLGVREPFVLYVGRLTARKNVDALVRAMACSRTAALTLVVVGARDKTCADLAALASAVNVADRVLFLGAMDLRSEELRVLFATATIFCFPSLEESFGLPPLEAMAAGAPSVVSNLPAIVETCGDAAVYVDATRPDAIAAAIDDLMTDPARRATLRAAGIERARAFTWERSARSLLDTMRRAERSQS